MRIYDWKIKTPPYPSPLLGNKIKDKGADKIHPDNAVYKRYISPPCTGDKIKDNDIDKIHPDNAVYSSYISCRGGF